MQTDARDVPGAMDEAWRLALEHPDPLIALAATRALRAHLSGWEARLAREAIEQGSTWEGIGESLGVSRQAAWERFHAEVPPRRRRGARHAYEEEVSRLRSEVERLRREARGSRS